MKQVTWGWIDVIFYVLFCNKTIIYKMCYSVNINFCIRAVYVNVWVFFLIAYLSDIPEFFDFHHEIWDWYFWFRSKRI